MAYTPANLANFFLHYSDTESYEKSLGDKVERYMDDLDDIVNDIIESWALKEVADIAALRALYEYTLWDSSATQHITRDNQIRKVISASDGTNTFMALYWFDDGATDTDADGATGNVDTDNIVSPLAASGTGRWKCIAKVYTDGTTAYVHRDGIEALRTMLKYLYINLTAGSSDVAIKTNKRTAGSQIKWTTDEVIAIRNIADNAYEDFAALAGTFAGAVSGTTGTFSGAVSGTTGTFSSHVVGVNGTFSGAVSGTTGTFSGAVSGTTGTFTGAGSFGGALDMNSNLINEVTDPVSAQDAATKAYVDAQVASSSPLWGDGSDGNVTISSNTTLTVEKAYNNLTIDATFTLTLAGFPIFVRGTLTWNGSIGTGTGGAGGAGQVGQAGAGSTGGTAGTNTVGIFPVSNGVVGGAGVSGMNGSNGTAGSNITYSRESVGTAVAGGAGGASEGAIQAGGTGGAAGTVTGIDRKFRDIISLIGFLQGNTSGIFSAAGSGAGGAGGGSSDPYSGGGGGGSGAAAQTGLIVASVIAYGGSSALLGVGGAGGNGGNGVNAANDPGGGGGGSGGPGAQVYTVTASVTGSLTTTTLTGGAAGTGGTNGGGAGSAGSNGTIGPTGNHNVINI